MPYKLSIPGWMPESELRILEQLAKAVPPGGEMVEVGPFCGRSSWCWSHSVGAGARVNCIDIWNPAEHPFSPPAEINSAESSQLPTDFGRAASRQQTAGTLENFRSFTQDCPNIVPIRGRSPTDFEDWPVESLDLVFLDGLHHNPGFAADLNFWYWRLVPGGIFCGDDCARTHPDVLWSVHDFCKDLSLMFVVTGRIWIVQRPPARTVSELFGLGRDS
jgi:hypothetical protein